MEHGLRHADHRKRRRRRRADRIPLFARLWATEQLKGEIGIVSRQFCNTLFGTPSQSAGEGRQHETPRFIAVTPSLPMPGALVWHVPWHVLPIRSWTEQEDGGLKEANDTTIYFPAAALALQTLAHTLQDESGLRGQTIGKVGLDVKVLDFEPVVLNDVFVEVDADALDRHDDVQRQFGGGFQTARPNGTSSKGKGKGTSESQTAVNLTSSLATMQTQDEGLKSAIRKALSATMIVHQGDLLLLPLPAHPITHVPFPPSKIILCEPVNQGILCDNTRIVVNRVRNTNPTQGQRSRLRSNNPLGKLISANGDDTANEKFYSAAENECEHPLGRNNEAGSSADSGSPANDSASSSEDSDGQVISLSTPSMSHQTAGVASPAGTSTPRLNAYGKHGIGTPGSVLSTYTTMTARQMFPGTSRTFQTQGLLAKISDDLLHPRPGIEEDEESRIFVDIRALLRLGCFSGDWVMIQGNTHSKTSPSGDWQFGALDHDDDRETFRPAKIYGLPNLQSVHSSRYTAVKARERRSSVAAAQNSNSISPRVWMSPILLYNLGQPASVEIRPLMKSSSDEQPLRMTGKNARVSAAAVPPLAKEVKLERINSPLSTERALQAGLFAALKYHFAQKRRILQQGDLIAFPVDLGTSRMLTPLTTSNEPDSDAELLLGQPLSEDSNSQGSFDIAVAWFKVGEILEQDSNSQDPERSIMWSGISSIEPSTTRMRQAGSDTHRLPSTLDSTWEYYLGVKPFLVCTSAPKHMSQATSSVPKPFITSLRQRLRGLMTAATSPRAVQAGLGPMVISLSSHQRNIGKATVAFQAASDLGIHVFSIDAHDIMAEGTGGGDVKTEAFLKARIDRALSCGPAHTAILIRHVEVLSADRMITALNDISKDVRLMITTTTALDQISDGIRSVFTHELELTAPDENERDGILRTIVEDKAIRLAPSVDLSSIAVKSAALVAGNLVDIVDRACIVRQERLEGLLAKSNSGTDDTELLTRDIVISGGDFAQCMIKSDLDLAVEAARKNFADAIGAPKIPNVAWDDVGGLQHVKDAVMETIQLPLERPELFAKGMKKRSGILFYGPPGTGKTLLAKAIATEFSLNFFSVKGPELLNMYIGESEANVRRVFQRARDARPCVVFFDELDSVAPKRGNQGDSGGVMDRIVSQLLAELDGMSDGNEGGGGVFVIGATNRPDLLDQALLRPGRFDKMLYLGIADTHDKQLTIIEALTRKFSLDPQLSLRRVAEALPFTYTGADLYALCSDAMLKAITRKASAVDAKIKALPGKPVTTAYFFDHLAKEEDVAVMVMEGDFAAAERELVGSVSAQELEHYQKVRQTFEGPPDPKRLTDQKPLSNLPTRIPAPRAEVGYHLQPPQTLPQPKAGRGNKLITATKAKTADRKGKGKGKGKATKWNSDDDDDEDEDDDEAYVTSNDYMATPERKSNGGFGNGTVDDDEQLYE